VEVLRLLVEAPFLAAGGAFRHVRGRGVSTHVVAVIRAIQPAKRLPSSIWRMA
jgi:hypothetical protein